MDLKGVFLEELRGKYSEAKEALKVLLDNPKDVDALNTAFRAFHTLKGSAGLVGFSNFQRVFHRLEDILKAWREDPSKIDRKGISRLLEALEYLSSRGDELSDGEIDEVERILEGGEAEREISIPRTGCEEFKELVEWILYELVELETHMANGSLDLAFGTLSTLKEKLIKIHEELEYTPLESVLKGFDVFVARDASDLGKEVEFEVRVEGVKVPKKDAGALREMLLHVVRNAVVHGVERPEERERIGKSRKGSIRIEADLEGDSIVISVEDDGKGVDFEKLEERARELGVEYSDPKELLFVSNLSTRGTVDEKGGRGIGLDAVKDYVERKGGKISVFSRKGFGTRFELRIPIERFLRKILVVRRGEGVFGVEVSKVDGVARCGDVFSNDGNRFVSVDGKVYRLEDVGEGDFSLLVLSGKKAIAVDEIVGLREAPVKLGENPLGFVSGFAVGIGRFPVPIVDPSKLESGSGEVEGMGTVLVVDDSPLTRLVVSRLLRRFGFDVVDVPNAREAVESLKVRRFDFAVVDLELPDMSGFELVEVIREKSPGTSIAVLTTAVSEENERRARELGVEFFPKGENLDRLLAFLKGD